MVQGGPCSDVGAGSLLWPRTRRLSVPPRRFMEIKGLEATRPVIRLYGDHMFVFGHGFFPGNMAPSQTCTFRLHLGRSRTGHGPNCRRWLPSRHTIPITHAPLSI